MLVAKPPWSLRPHTGRLERLILQPGAGRGRFSEVEGIPRSLGCIGNNRFILHREKLELDDMKSLLLQFRELGGEEVWLTNYDDPEEIVELARFSSSLGLDTRAVFLLEDLVELDNVKVVAELELERFDELEGADAALVMVEQEELEGLELDFSGELYIDVIFPGSLRGLKVNLMALRGINNPSTVHYHDCLAGTIAVTADGYLLPCPLLRKYVVADLRKSSLAEAVRRRYLRTFWRLTRDKIEACSSCPFRYSCHDCRALEYQATGDVCGVEFCPLPERLYPRRVNPFRWSGWLR